MKGIVNAKSGSLEYLTTTDVKKPTPKSNQVLISVQASAITNMEYMRYIKYINEEKTGGFALLLDIILGARGKILGNEMSGVIEEVGEKVKDFKKGDEVFGLTAGMKGSWGEYAVANEKEIAIRPSNLSFEQSAAIPVGAITALGAVYSAKIQEGQQVLIQGGSGGVGQYAVQLSKAQGGIVTAICSTRNIDMVRNFGADYVVDYKNEDITESGRKFDVIIAVNGYNPLSAYKRMLNAGGRFIFVGGTIKAIISVFGVPFYSIGSKRFGASAYPFLPKRKYLSDLKAFAEQGKLRPYVDKVFYPHDIADALRYVVNEHPQGKVVINLDFLA